MKQSIEEQVEELGGEEGFWRSDAQETLLKSIKELVDAGVEEQKAFDIVARVWICAAGEYGG